MALASATLTVLLLLLSKCHWSLPPISPTSRLHCHHHCWACLQLPYGVGRVWFSCLSHSMNSGSDRNITMWSVHPFIRREAKALQAHLHAHDRPTASGSTCTCFGHSSCRCHMPNTLSAHLIACDTADLIRGKPLAEICLAVSQPVYMARVRRAATGDLGVVVAPRVWWQVRSAAIECLELRLCRQIDFVCQAT